MARWCPPTSRSFAPRTKAAQHCSGLGSTLPVWTQISLGDPLSHPPSTSHLSPASPLPPLAFNKALLSELHNSCLCLVISQEWRREERGGSISLELIIAPGCSLWDWEKGPGGGLGSGPWMAFTISKDTDRGMCQVMWCLLGHEGTCIHSLTHSFICSFVHLFTRYCRVAFAC